MKILVTAFEPFGNMNTNSSLEVFKELSGENIIKLLLPVSYKRSKEILETTIPEVQPDFVLSLGQAEGEERIRVEYIGINYTYGTIPDNDGDLRLTGKVAEDGPDAIITGFPAEKLVNQLNERIPSRLSLSAGAYICNTVYYTALSLMKKKALFVHLPLYDGQKENVKSMPLFKMKNAVSFVISEIKNYLEEN